jgi:hypothetical protein
MRIDRVSRRVWLCGAGGALLAVPFLPSLVPSRAIAGEAENLRFVFVGSRYGRDIDRWYPADPTEETEGVYHSRLSDAGSVISPILGEAWNPLREKISLLRGLDGMQIAGDGHTPTIALTGSGSVQGQIGFGYSVDAVLAESSRIYPSLPATPAVRLCPAANPDGLFRFSVTSRSGPSEYMAYDVDPMSTYRRLFDPATLAERERFGERQAPVANAVMDDLRSVLGSSRISTDDRYKLEAHLSLLSDVEASLGVSVPACAAGTLPGAMEDAVSLHRAAIDLEIAALSCGLTRVAVHSIIQHDHEITPNEGEAHSAAHNGRSRSEESGRASIEQWILNRWSMERVAEYISRLDSTPDGDGTLLDHTVFLYGNMESRGFHSFYDMPVIVAGAPHKLRLGEYIDYRPRPLRHHDPALDVYAGRPYNNLLVTVLKAMGLEESDYQRFGRPGFGVYDQFDAGRLSEHYRPFLLEPNAPLPFLYRG